MSTKVKANDLHLGNISSKYLLFLSHLCLCVCVYIYMQKHVYTQFHYKVVIMISFSFGNKS